MDLVAWPEGDDGRRGVVVIDGRSDARGLEAADPACCGGWDHALRATAVSFQDV